MTRRIGYKHCEQLYSRAELADVLGRSPKTIHNWIHAGIIPRAPYCTKAGHNRWPTSYIVGMTNIMRHDDVMKYHHRRNNTDFVQHMWAFHNMYMAEFSTPPKGLLLNEQIKLGPAPT